MYEPSRCVLCSRTKGEHEQLEASGAINHNFSETGDLVATDRSTRRKAQPKSAPQVVGAIDIDLRRILLKRGIISNEDFAALYDTGAGADGDREAGSPEGSG